MRKSIKIGSQFTGVGAFEYAMGRVAKELGFDVENVYAAEWDKFARQAYLANHKEPIFYVQDVNDTPIDEIPELDIAMFSPPCQAFSLAGKRLGKNDEKGRGILFFNSHEFIQKNKPRFFIFENVKGLISDDSGKTFNEWITLLGGKSINGDYQFFPHEDSVPYHIYSAVLNAKNFNVPQNRERVFIIGIRDDEDNDFSFPKEVYLEKRLKDVLENDVDEKYFLSDKMVNGLLTHNKKHQEKGTGFIHKPKEGNDIASCIRANAALAPTDNTLKVGFINQDTQASQVFSPEGVSPTLSAGTHGYAQGYIEIADYRADEGLRIRKDGNSPCLTSSMRHTDEFKPNAGTRNPPLVIQVSSATSKGYEEATNEDSINFSNPHSKTRRGRVGKGVAQTLDTSCNQGVLVSKEVRTEESKKKRKETGTNDFRGKEIEFREQDCMNTITTSLTNDHYLKNNYRIRRLTPLEVFRLMDFPDSHVDNCRKVNISDSQLYKTAGNSIVVKCLELIIKNLKLV